MHFSSTWGLKQKKCSKFCDKYELSIPLKFKLKWLILYGRKWAGLVDFPWSACTESNKFKCHNFIVIKLAKTSNFSDGMWGWIINDDWLTGAFYSENNVDFVR